MTLRAAIILAFAEEVSVSVILGPAVIMAFAEEVSVRVICDAQECQVRVSEKSAESSKNVSEECQVRVSYKIKKSECSTEVSSQGVIKSVASKCLRRVPSWSVPQECPERVSHKSVE